MEKIAVFTCRTLVHTLGYPILPFLKKSLYVHVVRPQYLLYQCNGPVKCKSKVWSKKYNTFSSAVLLRKQRNASENWDPQGPVRKSAMQGHSRAFWAIASTDWKFQKFNFSFIYSLNELSWKERSKANLRVLVSICCSFCNSNINEERKRRWARHLYKQVKRMRNETRKQ